MTKGKALLVVAGALLAGTLAVSGVGAALAAGPGGQGSAPFGGMMGGFGGGGWGPGGMMGGGRGGMMGGYGPGGATSTYGPGGMMGGWSGQAAQNQGAPISLDTAVQDVQTYVDRTGNKDLTVDEVLEFQNNFYAIVKEKSTGTGAFELLVDKYSDTVFPEMGPNMMWNTKYGMMGGNGGMMGGYGPGGMMGGWAGSGSNTTTGPLTVTAEQAQKDAQTWLDQNQPGSTTETPDQFYGYYTVHTLTDGKVSGMLSVNGYTGAVWYHTWHGTFVQQKELGQ